MVKKLSGETELYNTSGIIHVQTIAHKEEIDRLCVITGCRAQKDALGMALHFALAHPKDVIAFRKAQEELNEMKRDLTKEA